MQKQNFLKKKKNLNLRKKIMLKDQFKLNNYIISEIRNKLAITVNPKFKYKFEYVTYSSTCF